MFGFLKKLFQLTNEERVSSSLMEKARASALLSENLTSASNLTSEGLTKFYYDNEELEQLQLQQSIHEHHQQLLHHEQLQQEMLTQQELQNLQQLQDMHDPYQNPGQDIVVDEHYHHIDHGLD